MNIAARDEVTGRQGDLAGRADRQDDVHPITDEQERAQARQTTSDARSHRKTRYLRHTDPGVFQRLRQCSKVSTGPGSKVHAVPVHDATASGQSRHSNLQWIKQVFQQGQELFHFLQPLTLSLLPVSQPLAGHVQGLEMTAYLLDTR